MYALNILLFVFELMSVMTTRRNVITRRNQYFDRPSVKALLTSFLASQGVVDIRGLLEWFMGTSCTVSSFSN